ncbi:MAG TPA: hypothetical protein VHT91_28395 [Kofleriaceae bacterium]|nr:hypothetical protein [Kofleriaceae bacterium]
MLDVGDRAGPPVRRDRQRPPDHRRESQRGPRRGRRQRRAQEVASVGHAPVFASQDGGAVHHRMAARWRPIAIAETRSRQAICRCVGMGVTGSGLAVRAPDGGAELARRRPEHSWSANHIATNVILFHLQRHSDITPTRPAAIRACVTSRASPELPSGYPAMFALACLPWVWRRVMDPRVIALAHGELSQIKTNQSLRP